MSEEVKDKPIKNYCNKCLGETNHGVLFEKVVSSDDDNYIMEWKYFVLQCLGCEEICFRKEVHDYEVTYPDEYDNWTHDITMHIYPLPLKNRKQLSRQYALPSQIQTVYRETINALKTNCYLLAGVGFRAVIEAVCLDKDIPGRTLEAKINNLSKNRLITDAESERLHAVRFLGNDSVHEMAVPKERTLYIVLEIIEHLLKNLYLIDGEARAFLDTYIRDFEDFDSLLTKKLKRFSKGDDFPLAKYLEKDIRRLRDQVKKFESELIDNIKNGNFTSLAISEVKAFGNSIEKVQHFIKL